MRREKERERQRQGEREWQRLERVRTKNVTNLQNYTAEKKRQRATGVKNKKDIEGKGMMAGDRNSCVVVINMYV